MLALCSPDGSQINPVYLRWGLVPFWAADKTIGHRLTNARAETLFTKPAFRNAVQSQRCLMVMSGFYEWREEQGVKQPYYFKYQQEEYLAIAALMDTWQQGEEVIHSCCLITTEANELMHPIHHRMPVIVPKVQQRVWLDNRTFSPQLLIDIMQPYPGQDLEYYPVTREMNRASFDSAVAIAPLFHHNKKN